MGNTRQVNFDPEFMELLVKTQLEATRLGLSAISTFQFFRVLIYNDNTYLSECLHFAGVNWNKVDTTMQKHFKNHVKEFDVKETAPITLGNEDGEIFTIVCEREFFDLIFNSTAYADDATTVSEVTVISALFCNEIPSNIINFLRQINVDNILVRRYFEGIMAEIASDLYMHEAMNEVEEEVGFLEDEGDELDELDEKANKSDSFEIPPMLNSCLSIITAYISKASPILGREKETQAIMKVLLKNKKRNCILVGNPGVGKTAIMEHLAWLIAKGECAEELKNKIILALNVNGIVAGTIYRGMAEERFKQLSDFLDTKTNIVLYIDEIHTVLGAGNTSDSSLDLANSLKPILARENVSVIGATTTEEYYKFFNKDKAFKRRFETIMVEIPEYEKVYPMLKKQINNLKSIHGVSITQPVINFIIKIASCFNFETCNPDVSLDLIDKSMAAAKMQEAKVVTKDIVLSNFANEYEEYHEMSKELKTTIAYHEAGHFLVGRYANFKKNKAKVLAISIIPAEDYLGLTVFDTDNNKLKVWTYKEIVEEIAVDLGGRVAEKMYTGSYSAGASGDLINATEHARAILLKYGLIPKFSKRNYEKDMDNDTKKELNSKIDDIINEGYTLAEAILKEHKEVLDSLSSSLVEKGILVDTEIEKICKEYEKNHKIKDPEVKLV